MLVIQLHQTKTPFAIIISNEMTGKLYTILYQDRYLRCHTCKKWEIRWIEDNKYLFKVVHTDSSGFIYEYKNFRKKMSHPLRHNFLVRNKIISSHYI